MRLGPSHATGGNVWNKDKKKTKVCRDCLRRKAVKLFHVKGRHPRLRYFSRCKACLIVFRNAPGKQPRKIGLSTVLSEKDKRERCSAWYAVKNAVNRGILKKPSHCEGCGKRTAKKNLAGHHHDYKDKLKVMWLCYTCHEEFEKSPSLRAGVVPSGAIPVSSGVQSGRHRKLG